MVIKPIRAHLDYGYWLQRNTAEHRQRNEHGTGFYAPFSDWGTEVDIFYPRKLQCNI